MKKIIFFFDRFLLRLRTGRLYSGTCVQYRCRWELFADKREKIKSQFDTHDITSCGDIFLHVRRFYFYLIRRECEDGCERFTVVRTYAVYYVIDYALDIEKNHIRLRTLGSLNRKKKYI